MRYRSVYAGVDLVYYGSDGQLEYDFLVSPQGKTSSIRLRFAGAEKLDLNAEGDLVVSAGGGAIVFRKPALYQEIAGQRRSVDGAFTLVGKDTVGFRAGAYDRAKALVIDPVLAYSTYLGGSSFSEGDAVAVDGAGDAYVVGTTSASDFPVTPGAYQTDLKASGDEPWNAFITKLNSAGTELIYSTYLGGSAGEDGLGVAVDTAGDAFVTGLTFSSDFPTTPGAFQTVNKGASAKASNGFVAKLNPTGTALLYSTFLGGTFTGSDNFLSGDQSNDIVVDSSGNAYVSGSAESTDFPVSRRAFQTANLSKYTPGPVSGFVTKLNPTGTALIYSTYLGGSGFTVIDGMAVDASGHVFVTGATSSTDFAVTPGAFQTVNRALTADGDPTAFVTKFNPGGTGLVYSTYLGGSLEDSGFSVAIDRPGNAYVTGETFSTDFPVTPGAFQMVNKAAAKTLWNAFVTKINPYGGALVYSTYLGGSGVGIDFLGSIGGDEGNRIAVDAAGHAYVAGGATSTDFPVTGDALQSVNNAAGEQTRNAFLTKVDATGTGLLYSTYLGGSGGPTPPLGDPFPANGDGAFGLAVDSSGAAYIAGSASSSDFPTTAGSFDVSYPGPAGSGIGEVFVAKLDIGDATITPVIAVTPSPSPVPRGDWLEVDVTVSGGANTPTPTGRVRLTSGGYESANLLLSGGSTAFYFPAKKLALGLNTLTVTYTPDSASSVIYVTATGTATVTVD